MAFETLPDLDCETTTALGGVNKETGKANPKQAEGYFLGTKLNKSTKSKDGLSRLHILQTPKGNLGVWGKTDLDRKMLAVTPGTMIRITQTHSIETKNGDMYKFQVEVDAENTITVAVPANTPVVADDSEPDFSNEDFDGGSFEDEVPAERPVAPRAKAQPNAARTQALLNGNKSRVSR